MIFVCIVVGDREGERKGYMTCLTIYNMLTNFVK